jgi:type IX secretion system PorP/SprF family membrane protein
MKRLMSICFLAVCSCLTLFAQIDPLFLQQANNRVTINPAATGKGGDINASLGLRQQWIGFSGPATRVLNANGFVKEIRSGFGLTWLGDQFGPQRTQNLKVNYAYFIPFENRAFLSLGLGMGMLNNVYDETEFFAMDDNDDAITYIKESKIIPDFDFGFEFNMRNFEIGASVAHVTS